VLIGALLATFKHRPGELGRLQLWQRRHNYSHSTRRPRIGSTGIRWGSRKTAHFASGRKSQ